MKRIVCLVLVVVLSLSVCACGGRGEDGQEASLVDSSDEFSYNLPTATELLDSYEADFTLSNISVTDYSVKFTISEEEILTGRIDDSGKVYNILVGCSGPDINQLLKEERHFYPVCHYLSEVKGEEVTVDMLLDIIREANSTYEGSAKVWSIEKDGIAYKLEARQISAIYEDTMRIMITVL